MSDIMRPIPFAQLMDWILTENAEKGSIFGIRKIVRHEGGAEPIFAEKIETPFGPAAGPNSQLTQNIVAPPYGPRAATGPWPTSTASKTWTRTLSTP